MWLYKVNIKQFKSVIVIQSLFCSAHRFIYAGHSRPAARHIITAVATLSAVVPLKVRRRIRREADTLTSAD